MTCGGVVRSSTLDGRMHSFEDLQGEMELMTCRPLWLQGAEHLCPSQRTSFFVARVSARPPGVTPRPADGMVADSARLRENRGRGVHGPSGGLGCGRPGSQREGQGSSTSGGSASWPGSVPGPPPRQRPAASVARACEPPSESRQVRRSLHRTAEPGGSQTRTCPDRCVSGRAHRGTRFRSVFNGRVQTATKAIPIRLRPLQAPVSTLGPRGLVMVFASTPAR